LARTAVRGGWPGCATVTRSRSRSIVISAASIEKPGASTDAARRSYLTGAGSRPAMSTREHSSLAANADAYSGGPPSNSGPGGVGPSARAVAGAAASAAATATAATA
jgi:hypothetical protein